MRETYIVSAEEKMADPKRYRRIKLLNFFQLVSVKTGENEQMVAGNRPVEGLFVASLTAELVKNIYFAYRSTDLSTRILFGDLIISPGEDQRLFNVIVAVAYFFMIVSRFYYGCFKGQKTRFFELSQILLVLDHEAYAKRFFVSKSFVLKFTKEMDFLTGICPFLVKG